MSKSTRIRDQRSADMEKAALLLGTKKTTLPNVLPTVPALDANYMAQLNAIKEAQQAPAKAMRKELAVQLKKAHMKFLHNEIAVILWALHKVFGFDYYRLLKFVAEYKKAAKALTDYYDYEYEDENCCYLFADKLKQETGIDVDRIDAQVNEILDPNNHKNPHSKIFKERA